MITNHIYNQYDPQDPSPRDTVFFFRRGEVLIRTLPSGEYRCPTVEEAGSQCLRYLFRIDDTCYFMREESETVPEGYEYVNIRHTRTLSPHDLSFAVMTGYHLYQWYHYHQFCGRCGTRLEHHPRDRKMICPKCGHAVYPYVKPAIIVAITDGDRLLLTTRPGHDIRALVAGYCEIGESAEEAVSREVREETGLAVTDLKYFGTQPWGYDANLMIGYFARVKGDPTPHPDMNELSGAVWVHREEIEDQVIPSLGSEMIMYFKYHGWFSEEVPSEEYFRF